MHKHQYTHHNISPAVVLLQLTHLSPLGENEKNYQQRVGLPALPFNEKKLPPRRKRKDTAADEEEADDPENRL